jgi:hypothetical protein
MQGMGVSALSQAQLQQLLLQIQHHLHSQAQPTAPTPPMSLPTVTHTQASTMSAPALKTAPQQPRQTKQAPQVSRIAAPTQQASTPQVTCTTLHMAPPPQIMPTKVQQLQLPLTSATTTTPTVLLTTTLQQKPTKAQAAQKQKQLEHTIQQLQQSVEDLERDQVLHAKTTVSDKMKQTTSKTTKTTPAATTSTAKTNKENKKKAHKKKAEHQRVIPDYTDDEASLNDGVDYTKEENYAVKKFIGHQEVPKKRSGKEIQLMTRWKGWRDKKSITMEPLEIMAQDWPNEVRAYCNKNPEIDSICRRDYGHLFDG